MLEIFLSALVAIIVAYLTARASSYSKDVVEERRNWREKIRNLGIKAAELIREDKGQTDEYIRIISEFRLRLNPDDGDDQEIMACLWRYRDDGTDKGARELLARVARLLKHDWDRAVWETKILKMPSFRKSLCPDNNVRKFKEDDTKI